MDEGLIGLAEILEGLHSRWQPHAGQIPIGRALFYQGFLNIFVMAGKNFGKTELASYIGWRWSQEHPGSESYIIEPFSVQAKEILWASNRIQGFGDPDLIEDVNNSEMRLKFKNGSFIKLIGSDNEAALAGIKPRGIIIYDELKDHRESAIKLMEPNRAAFNIPAVFIGTPPEVECYFTKLMEHAKKSPEWAFFHAPTSSNPHISRKWLENKKEELISMGDETTWLRDYEAIFVKGGKRHLVPQFLTMEKKMTWPTDPHKWQLFTIFDPAGSSTFGVLFMLFNPYSKLVKIAKEIYEQDMALMTAKGIWDQTKPIVADIKTKGISSFEYVYDEAASSFRNEMNSVAPEVWLQPTHKSDTSRGEGLSILRDLIRLGMIEVSPECVKFIWEVENYIKDEKGKIPKKNDHLIDCCFYGLQAMGFTFEQVQAPKEKELDTMSRFTKLEDELNFNNTLNEFDQIHDGGSMEEL